LSFLLSPDYLTLNLKRIFNIVSYPACPLFLIKVLLIE
jgi:hypothetical protein